MKSRVTVKIEAIHCQKFITMNTVLKVLVQDLYKVDLLWSHLGLSYMKFFEDEVVFICCARPCKYLNIGLEFIY